MGIAMLILFSQDAWSQDWERITEDLFAQGEDSSFTRDPLNRKLGCLVVKPSGELLLVRNGQHPVYHSQDQGVHWHPLEHTETVGRAYGSYSANVDYTSGRVAIFTIVQQKNAAATGLILSSEGKVLTQINKPKTDHDGWTWGMAAWEQHDPEVILGKEHHKWVIMWLSKDGGSTWEQLPFKSRNPGVIDAHTFVAGNDDGIYRSEDQGETWEKISEFVVTGKNPIRYGDHFYWTTQQGVIRSTDHGRSWEFLNQPLEGALWGPYFGLNEQSMMVVTHEGFWVSQDAGAKWIKVADYFAPPGANLEGQYDITHPTNSYGWDEKRGILYAAGLGADAYRLVLNEQIYK